MDFDKDPFQSPAYRLQMHQRKIKALALMPGLMVLVKVVASDWFNGGCGRCVLADASHSDQVGSRNGCRVEQLDLGGSHNG